MVGIEDEQVLPAHECHFLQLVSRHLKLSPTANWWLDKHIETIESLVDKESLNKLNVFMSFDPDSRHDSGTNVEVMLERKVKLVKIVAECFYVIFA